MSTIMARLGSPSALNALAFSEYQSMPHLKFKNFDMTILRAKSKNVNIKLRFLRIFPAPKRPAAIGGPYLRCDYIAAPISSLRSAPSSPPEIAFTGHDATAFPNLPGSGAPPISRSVAFRFFISNSSG